MQVSEYFLNSLFWAIQDIGELHISPSYKFTTSLLKHIIGRIKDFDDDMPCATNIWLGTRESPKELIPPEITLAESPTQLESELQLDFTT